MPSRFLLGTLLLTALSRPAPAEPVPAVHVVLLEEASLAAYEGGVPGLKPTSPRALGTARLDPRSEASRNYLAWLRARQDLHLDRFATVLGHRPEVVFRYRGGANGLALRLSPAEADRIAAMPGVREVVEDHDLPLDTDRGPTLIGAGEVWDGTALGTAVLGEGVIVGIIDTGVNMGHPSFADDPVDGHVFVNPFGPGVHVGWCDPGHPNYSPAYVCNEKLIGAWDFVDAVSVDADGPEDSDGHGSHTASTAAGNRVDYSGDGIPDMSGVAPHANLITYDACYVDPGTGLGLCPFSATSAAVDRAILDGVDVINYSIGGGGSPWSFSDIDRYFLNAFGAGIFVAASAGNSGPGASTTGHLAPWVTTVGASTMDRGNVQNALVDLAGGGSPPAAASGLSRTRGYGPAPIVYAGDFANGDPNPEQCLHPFPPGTFSGEIVVCDRGSLARVMKGQNVLAGGAGGFVLANVAGGATNLVDDAHVLPAIHVDVNAGNALRTWLASGSGHVATITPGVMQIDPAAADIMGSFSSRGPNPSFDVLKPDVTNPGVNVYAAYRAGFLDEPGLPPYAGLELAFLSGTSMSSPHTAGAGALVRSAHPGWSPAAIKSALMTTATGDVRKEDGISPADAHDMGGGRVRVDRAVQAGLVLDETQAAFLAANPSTGGDPRALNLASLTHGACGAFCEFSRTVTNPLPVSVTWTASGSGPAWMSFDVQPAMFTLGPGASQPVTIRIGAAGGTVGTWAFGEVLLTPDDAAIPDAHLTAAIRPAGVAELEVAGTRIGDVILGNGNGVPEPYEVITLEVDLLNVGSTAATGISAQLSTTTPGVSILEDQAAWDPIEPSQVGTSLSPHFRLAVDGSVPCGTSMDLQLDVTADHGPSQFPVSLTLGALGTPSGDFGAGDTPVPIPDNSGAGADSVIPIGETFQVADLDAAVTISHGRISDLEVDLVSPLGTVVRLHDRTGGDTADLDTVYDTLTAPDGPGVLEDFVGEPVAGNWTLHVADRRNMIAGQITAWSLSFQGAPTVLCEPVPCKVGAAITAGPSPACGGEPVTVSGIGSLFAGEDCGGTLEYRLEGNAGVLQDWSPDPDVVDFPDQDQIYTVQARDPSTGALSLATAAVTASPTPAPVISQSPDPVCSEVGDAALDGGDGFAAYVWRDGGDQIVGTERMLTLSGDACLQSFTLSVTSPEGCSGETGSFAAACVPCTPGEISPPGSPVPFRLSVDAAGTLEFGLLPDPDVEYNLIVADSVGAILSGEYTHRYCDLESNSFGTWNPLDAETARWTPLAPGLLVQGMWVVFAERTNAQGVFPGPYGAGSDGTPRPADTDGQGSIGNADCP